jgi:hypothetical protein
MSKVSRITANMTDKFSVKSEKTVQIFKNSTYAIIRYSKSKDVEMLEGDRKRTTMPMIIINKEKATRQMLCKKKTTRQILMKKKTEVVIIRPKRL